MEKVGYQKLEDDPQDAVSSSSGGLSRLDRVRSAFHSQKRNFAKSEGEFKLAEARVKAWCNEHPATVNYTKASEKYTKAETAVTCREDELEETNNKINKAKEALEKLKARVCELNDGTPDLRLMTDDNDAPESAMLRDLEATRDLCRQVEKNVDDLEKEQEQKQRELEVALSQWEIAGENCVAAKSEYEPVLDEANAAIEEATRRRFANPKSRARLAQQDYDMARLYAKNNRHPFGLVKALKSYQAASDKGNSRGQFSLARALAEADKERRAERAATKLQLATCVRVDEASKQVVVIKAWAKSVEEWGKGLSTFARIVRDKGGKESEESWGVDEARERLAQDSKKAADFLIGANEDVKIAKKAYENATAELEAIKAGARWFPAVKCLYSDDEQWAELSTHQYELASDGAIDTKVVAKADFAIGVECYNKNQFWEAFPHFAKAAVGGYSKAWYRLGTLHLEGKGTPQNLADAVNCFRHAAGGGYAAAHYQLGLAHYRGWAGLTNLKGEAKKCFLLAAEAGDAKAWGVLREYYSIVSAAQPNESGRDASHRVVTTLATYLLEHSTALDTKGIFRESADQNELNRLDDSLFREPRVDLSLYSPLTLADCLKRNLGASPVFRTPKDFQSLEALDEGDRALLMCVIRLVQETEKRKEVNNMSFKTLAVTIGTRLFPPLVVQDVGQQQAREATAEQVFRSEI